MRIFLVLMLALVLFSCGEKPNSVKKKLSGPVKKEDTRLFDILTVEKTGIDFENKLTESLAMNGFTYEYYYNGAGLAVADFNNDGLQDVYFVSNRYANKLYQNTGKLRFKDITNESGASRVKGFATGVTTVDINADGLMDIYISTSGKFNDTNKLKNQLLVNKGIDINGIPHFIEEGAKYNLDIKLCSTQAAFFDYDRDNDLDMFLINHYPDPYAYGQIKEFLNMKSNFTGDRLYENRDGKFFDISEKAGIVSNRLSYALGVGVGDLNNDGWPDVFVSNDYSGKDHLYINNQDGTLSEIVDESLNHMSFASMGNDIGDFNNDGWADIFTLDMMAEDNYGIKTSLGAMKQERFQNLVNLGLHQQYMYNTLQLNNGTFNKHQKPFFSDIAHLAGIPSTDWSWAPLLFDMDNDGHKDLFVANGIKGDFVNNDFVEFIAKKQKEIIETGQMDKNEYLTSILNRLPRRMRNNYFYKNRGDLTFEKKNKHWVNDIETCSNGSAYADFDNDGDMDLIVNNSESKSFIYKNNARETNMGNYLQFQFEGPASNPLGIGTKVVVKQKDQIQVHELYLSRGFQSSTSPVVHFGIGTDESVPEVQIIWPDGKKQVITDLKSNKRISVSYKDAGNNYNFNYPDNPLFINVTSRLKLNYAHVENEFDDYKRENLLPHKMSGLGPALAVADVNNDGLDDFYVGGAKGYSGKLFVQESGGFKIKGNNPWGKDKKSEDIKATFFDADNDGDPDLYVTSGSNENRNGSAPLQDRLYINTGSNNF
ncbi:MAG: FG-GAP-like repeat-containing protein, partial [Bacteroidota bacterium]